jgi:hypothetical protein
LLSKVQDSALYRYIEILDKHDLSPSPTLVEKAANSILSEDHTDPLTPPPTVSEHWAKRFFNRHPEFKLRKTRAIDLDRKKAHEPETIQGWFDRLKQIIEQHGIHESDMWNFDETGFNIGIGRDQWIVTCEFKKPLYRGSNTNREYATLVEAVNATGDVIPPFIILSGKCILKGWFDTIEFISHIGISETGYINDTLAYQWIQHFHHSTKHRIKGTHRLLLCDGYGSHMTREFVKFCEDNHIIYFFLISHTSHILQPLDVGVFQAYKHWHSEAIAEASQLGIGKFTKNEFLYVLKTIRQKTFKPQTIYHGFARTGIFPYNPRIVIENLEEFQLETPPQALMILIIFEIPKTVSTIAKLGV